MNGVATEGANPAFPEVKSPQKAAEDGFSAGGPSGGERPSQSSADQRPERVDWNILPVGLIDTNCFLKLMK